MEESFAQSVLWGFTVAAEQGDGVLVDATDFFLNDIHGVAGVLKETKQGEFRLEPSRCALYEARTKNFPQNTEVEAMLTFITQEKPGEYAQSVAPNPRSITVRERHSFMHCPSRDSSPGSTIRARDISIFPGSTIQHRSCAAAKRFITRHRLAKRDPSAAVSETVTPIVYYLDPGRRSRCVPRFSTAPAGGTRPLRPPAIATPSGSKCCRTRGPARCPLQHDPVGASRHAGLELWPRALPIREPARSSRVT